MLLTLGDIPHHGPVLLAWVLLRHTLQPVEAAAIIKRLGHTTLQLGVFQYLTDMLQALGSTGNNVRITQANIVCRIPESSASAVILILSHFPLCLRVLQCTASTARMCIYGLLSFVVTSFEEDTLGSQQV